MAFPILVGGSDCGPVNPLQGLTKSFDQDRGIQQDYFGVSRAGPSRETFRTQQTRPNQADRDAANFFSATLPSGPSAFDLSGLHATLPIVAAETPPSFQLSKPQSQVPAASWVTDFTQYQRQAGPEIVSEVRPQSVGTDFNSASQENARFQSPVVQHSMRHAYQIPIANGFQNQVRTVNVQHDPSLWDQDFLKEERHSTAITTSEPPAMFQDPVQEQNLGEADALSRTAGLLVDTLRDEQNPKFKNSEFMGLMRSLRDRSLVVDGNEIVLGKDSAPRSAGGVDGDVKGKGRAPDVGFLSQMQRPLATISGSLQFEGNTSVERAGEALRDGNVVEQPRDLAAEASSSSLDEVYEYFRQDNEDYIEYQNARYNPVVGSWDDNTAEWDKLQRDWDLFEATAVGMRPIANYQFTPNNPYLVGDRSRTSLDNMSYNQESVLQLEAAIQRDHTNAQAWFALGVRQQDNEREPKAIEALRRSLELDPNYMPSWLALGISYANESNRQGAYNAIREWVERHKRYASLPMKLSGLDESIDILARSSQTERYEELINCLIAMARGDVDGDIDADIQIALAVLLNSNEEYAKATDCFLTALAIRPHDWVLYNRVGATLANNGKAGEALEYYYRALELNPMYIRARFNAGISCINLHRYEESGRHLLDALTLQDSDADGVTSAALWHSLRTVCAQLDKELVVMCDSQDLEGLRRNFHPWG